MLALTGLPDTPAVHGPRPVQPGDVPEVIALVDAAMRAGTDQSMLSDYPLVYAESNLRNVRVIRADGELVSVVPVLPRSAVLDGRRIRVGIISPTATAPAHRHLGYASRCLASALEAMREEGCALSVLWTLVETFPFYERAGYHAVPYQGVAYPVSGADNGAFPADETVAIRPLDPSSEADLDAVRALHDADARWDPLESTCRHASLSIL